MLAIIRFSLKDMVRNYKLWLAMVMLIAATDVIYLGLGGYRNVLQEEFGDLPFKDLIVQESNTTGEFFGSRLSSEVGNTLIDMGISQVIPEIHDYTGTSIAKVIILRGIDLERYKLVNSFRIIAGHAMEPGDARRTAMIGWRLASRYNLSPGQEITLRGRPFLVEGIFQAGTYVDNEAWISLEDAQVLLGYGKDVSIYIIPDEGILIAGDTLPGGISVVRRGQGPRFTSEQFNPLFKIMEQIYFALGIAAILTLASVLFRLAWIHRRELAILRCLGFKSRDVIVYLLCQALVLAWFGVILGFISAALLFSLESTEAVGMTLRPTLGLQTGIASLLQSTGIALFGTALPAWWFTRMNLANQLRSE